MPKKKTIVAKPTKGKKPTTTGRSLAATRGKGKKTGLKRQGY